MEPKALEPGAGLGAVGEQPKNANLAKGPAVLALQKERKDEGFCSGFKWLGETMCSKGPGLGFLSAEEPRPWVNASSWAANPNQGWGEQRESKRVPSSCPAVKANNVSCLVLCLVG